MTRNRIAVLLGIVGCSIVLGACVPLGPDKERSWIAAWISPPSPFLPGGHTAYLEPYSNVTVRQVARVDAGGTELRVRFTNELGSERLHIGAATIGRAGQDGKAKGEPIGLTFGGARSVAVPPGAMMLSDPLHLRVERFDDVVINVFFPEPTRPSGHRHQVDVSFPGDHTDSPGWEAAASVRGATAISGVQVQQGAWRRVLVTFGDSITEGAGATPGAHMSWPAQLSRALAQRDWARDWVVVNAGISGNRILHDGGSQNALARFERDVLSVAGVTDVIVLEGVNDLGVAYGTEYGGREIVTAEELILAYGQMIERAHLRGIRIYGATILPYAGAAYYAPAGERERRKVNAWIRDSGAFDGIIDLDAAMRNPGFPERLIEKYEIGDRLHPGDAGYGVMADAVEAFLEGQ